MTPNQDDLTILDVIDLERGHFNMASKAVSIPGGATSFSSGPALRIVGVADQALAIEVKYNARPKNEGPPVCGVLTFDHVLQYRWIKFGYEHQLGNTTDVKFGLLEIVDSELIEGMRRARSVPQPEIATARHYRMSWDDWGTIDVVCKSAHVAETGEDCP